MWTKKAFIFLKELTQEEIWRSKDFLNRDISWTLFKKPTLSVLSTKSPKWLTEELMRNI